MRTLNLGILAHVDAGKTSLTERLLYAAGVIDEIGSVDDGSTQTDSLALERQRGITIKAAVVSFAIDDVTVNLIDTPGHPDFIAEVERALSVLDGAVLVVSAVEGVQAQTRVLMRTLQRLRIPTLLFVNKIDRARRQDERVLRAIAEKLTPAISRWGRRRALGTRAAPLHPARADRRRLHRAGSPSGSPTTTTRCWPRTSTTRRRHLRRLRARAGGADPAGAVHPVYFGSAITGAGVDALMAGITELLPADRRRRRRPGLGHRLQDRARAGRREDRLRRGCSRARCARATGCARRRRADASKVTAISVFDRGSAVQRARSRAGQIGKLWGLGERPDRRRDRRPRTAAPSSPIRAADAGDGRRPPPTGRQGRTARRAHPARRAGPADQPAPGRRRGGAVRLALRRGAEGGHRGHARRRVRDRRRLPRDDDDLHRAAGRGQPARGAAPGPPRLGGDRLRGGHDPFGLRGPAEPLTRHLRQERVPTRRATSASSPRSWR